MTQNTPSQAEAQQISEHGTSLKFRWHIPSSLGKSSPNNVKRSNRYLRHKNIQISKLIEEGKTKLAIQEFKGMLKTSKSLRVYALNNGLPGGYFNLPLSEVKRIYKRLDRMMISLPLYVPLKRKYIPKKNGKMRPLGIPDVAARILNSLGASFIYALAENRIMDRQHGFRKKRGIGSAGRSIIDEYKQSDGKVRVIEFDLKSFFNTVNPVYVGEMIAKIDGGLAKYVTLVNRLSVAKIDKLEEEEEYKGYMKRKKLLQKLGLPQGLPGSPLLASLCLGPAGFDQKNILMYADDGLIFFDPKECPDPIRKIMENPDFTRSGIRFSGDKTSAPRDKLKFLGITLDIQNKKLQWGELVFDAESITDEQLKKICVEAYDNKRADKGEGKYVKGALLDYLPSDIDTGINRIKGVVYLIVEQWTGVDCRNTLGIKLNGIRHNHRIINFQTRSTEACSGLIKKNWRTKRKVRVQVPFEKLDLKQGLSTFGKGRPMPGMPGHFVELLPEIKAPSPYS